MNAAQIALAASGLVLPLTAILVARARASRAYREACRRTDEAVRRLR